MENKKEKTNQCPVCGQATSEDESMVFCTNCGFNVRKQEQHTKQNAV